jgi:hypothetical protein
VNIQYLEFGVLWLVHGSVTVVCFLNFWWLTPKLLPVLGTDSSILLLWLSESQTLNVILDSARLCAIMYCPPCLLRGSSLRQNYRPIHVSNLYVMYVFCTYTLALGNNIWQHSLNLLKLKTFFYEPPALTFRNSVFCTVHLCVWFGSQNKLWLFLYTALTDWFYNRGRGCLLRGTSRVLK